MIKHAQAAHPVNALLTRRWSPYGFDSRPVAREDVRALFEAARWAPSSYNAQPWRYIVAERGDALFERVLSCLWDANQAWARHAAVLALGITRTTFPHNGSPNAAAEHDLGLAAASLSFEATARGIAVHQMIGVHTGRVRTEFALPEEYRPLTALAIGYPGKPADLAGDVLARDDKPRERRPLAEFVFGAQWGEASPAV
jgi:nitroreductase